MLTDRIIRVDHDTVEVHRLVLLVRVLNQVLQETLQVDRAPDAVDVALDRIGDLLGLDESRLPLLVRLQNLDLLREASGISVEKKKIYE